ncbi:MAG: tRNA lysidine(34) synthetase TilS [Rhodocyclaceae bacterium]|nr:tRNA lysidine(34) synthetase TilS [Rhodocyclaceae bacterium]
MAVTRNSRFPDVLAAVRAVLAARAGARQRVCVGLSGGVDSSVLLDCAARLQPELGFHLSALHVHHGLSPNADAWAKHCQALCERLEVPLQITRVTVVEQGEGVEAAARHARYGAFSQCGADYLLLAHHADDQAETLLHNLLRGAGVKGAAAMPAERPLCGDGLRLLRPLLGLRRAALVAYARERGMDWIEDEANVNPRYARSALRHEILPCIEKRWPAAVTTLVRAAARFAEADELLQQIGLSDLRACEREGGLDVAAISLLPASRARNCLRVWLAEHGVAPPTSQRLAEWLRQLESAAEARTMAWHTAGKLVFRYRGLLLCAPLPNDVPACVAWRREPEIDWGGTTIALRPAWGAGLLGERLDRAQVEFRRRAGGEKLRIGGHLRALKQLCQEHGVAPPLRSVMPLMYCDGELVWVPGVGCADTWSAGPAQPGLLPDWSIAAPPGRVREASD